MMIHKVKIIYFLEINSWSIRQIHDLSFFPHRDNLLLPMVTQKDLPLLAELQTQMKRDKHKTVNLR